LLSGVSRLSVVRVEKKDANSAREAAGISLARVIGFV
jgi:hypothetical protein